MDYTEFFGHTFFFLGGGRVYNIHSKKILFGKSQFFCAVKICLSFAKTRKPSGFRHFYNKRNLRSFRGIEHHACWTRGTQTTKQDLVESVLFFSSGRVRT